MDELEEAKDAGEAANSATPPSEAPQSEEEERGARVDAAKAFFRAMYAGEEPPAAFGAPQGQGQSDTATQTACRNCEAMEFSLKESEAKATEAETLYKRMAADFDNYRRRMEREREESIALGVKKAAEAIMPALDDLDRAMSYLNPDTPADKLLESFKLVSNRILHCMDQVGLKPIKAVGELFDPKFHEPVQQVETNEHADGAVMSELRKGYMLHDKVVRPALVNVASNATGVVVPAEAAATGSGSSQQTAAESAREAEIEILSPIESAEANGQTDAAPAAAEAVDDADTVYDLGDVPDV